MALGKSSAAISRETGEILSAADDYKAVATDALNEVAKAFSPGEDHLLQMNRQTDR